MVVTFIDPFQVVTWYEKGTLLDSHENRLSQLTKWMTQVAEAIDYLHQQGFMYTDLKAESVKYINIVHSFIYHHAGIGISFSMRRIMRNWGTWKAFTLKVLTTT